MKRPVLNALTLVSLLLSVAAASLWVRSYWVADDLRWVHKTQANAIQWTEVFSSAGAAGCGSLTLTCHTTPPEVVQWFQNSQDSGWRRNRPAVRATWAANLWPRSTRSRRPAASHTSDQWHVQVPYWMPLLAALLLPAARSVVLVRRRRFLRQGRCPACGFDLRSSPDRCPECGTPTSRAPAPTPRPHAGS